MVGYSFYDQNSKTSKVKLYSTETGESFCEHDLTHLHYISNDVITARGSYVSCTDGLVIHVIRKSSNACEKFHFTFPTNHFIKLKAKCFKPAEDLLKFDFIVLEGFVGKSNVLIGRLGPHSGIGYVLMSLDIDAVISAKNEHEVTMAFSLPLNPRGKENKFPGTNCNNKYLPVYRTDRVNECVDLVGVMQRKEKTARETLETTFL